MYRYVKKHHSTLSTSVLAVKEGMTAPISLNHGNFGTKQGTTKKCSDHMDRSLKDLAILISSFSDVSRSV